MMMMTTLQQQQIAAKAQALEEALFLILGRRPDLQREALLAALVAHAERSPHSLQDWAEHCLDRVREGDPLPWEPGATGVGVRL